MTTEDLRKYLQEEIKKRPYPWGGMCDEEMVNAFRNVLSQLPEPKEEKSEEEKFTALNIIRQEKYKTPSDPEDNYYSETKVVRAMLEFSSKESDEGTLKKELADFLVWYSGTPRAGRTTNACIDMYINFKAKSRQ